MAMTSSEIESLIRKALPDAQIELTALEDDGDHWQARVVSSAFAGLSRVRQHQLVYAALGPHMGETLHALALQTETPDTTRQAQ